jgi:PAS domain S-box-containing protein
MNFIWNLFDAEGFTPRRLCGEWTLGHILLHNISDLLIWGSYFSIPILLLFIVRRRREPLFTYLGILFAAFIVSCGTTHFMDFTLFYYPAYRLAGIVKAVTAVASIWTAFEMWRLYPLILAMRSPQDLDLVVQARTRDLETRTKELEEANRQVKHKESQLADFFENAPVGLHWLDKEGRIIRANKAELDLMGYSSDEFVGKHVCEIIMNDDVLAAILDLPQNPDSALDAETQIICKGGTIKHVLISSNSLLQDGEFIHTRCFMRDISERKQIEEAANRTIRHQAEEARNRDNFLAMLAHELRNPLAPIENCLGILQMNIDQETADWAKDTMHRQVQHMVRIIDDLLNLSRMQRNKIELQKANARMVQVAFSAIEIIKPMIEENEHQFRFHQPSEDIVVFGDETRLAQVISNLLSNAVKYTKSGGEIEMELTKKDDRAYIIVRDNGVGMDGAVLPHIFEPFYQADRTLDRSKGGLGIGLAVVKTMVELHEGVIDVKSELGKGTTFTLSFPLVAGDVGVNDSRTNENGGNKIKKRVLVVDDNTQSAKTLAVLLNLHGHKAMFVFDGPTAIKSVEEFKPDVILLDIGLPKMDGYEVCKTFRELECTKDLLIIAMTGYGADEDRSASAEAGMDYHLVKPVKYAVLDELFSQGRPES